jgi:hypothetical protein
VQHYFNLKNYYFEKIVILLLKKVPTKFLKYLLLPLFIIHTSYYFGNFFPAEVVAVAVGCCFSIFLFVCTVKGRVEKRFEPAKSLRDEDYSRFKPKYIFIGIFGLFYFISIQMVAIGSSSVKEENNIFFLRDEKTRIYHEVSFEEYELQAKKNRIAYSGVPILFGFIFYLIIRVERD